MRTDHPNRTERRQTAAQLRATDTVLSTAYRRKAPHPRTIRRYRRAVRIPDYAIGPGEPSPAEIDDAEVVTGIIAGEPVLMLLVRFRVAKIAADATSAPGARQGIRFSAMSARHGPPSGCALRLVWLASDCRALSALAEVPPCTRGTHRTERYRDRSADQPIRD